MTDLGNEIVEPKTTKAERGEERRRPTPRKYPYYSLKTAIAVAESLLQGTEGSATRAQAAELLHIPKNSSGLEMRLITAASFGLVRRQEGNVEVTDLARKLVQPASSQERTQALAKAFASIPLFSHVQKTYAGQPLPTEKEVKNLLRRNEVREKQVNEAYNILIASAREAELLKTVGADTWLSVTPQVVKKEEEGMAKPEDKPRLEEEQQILGTSLMIDQAMIGLLRKLPQDGRFQNGEQRDKWKKAFDALFEYLYPLEQEE